MDNTEKLVRTILLIWFIIASLFVFVPAGFIFTGLSGDGMEMPKAPTAPTLIDIPRPDAPVSKEVRDEHVKYAEGQLTRYDKQVASYKASLDAYKTAEATRGDLLSSYKAIVADVIADLVKTFITALLAYAFVRAGVQLVRAFAARRRAPASGTEA